MVAAGSPPAPPMADTPLKHDTFIEGDTIEAVRVGEVQSSPPNTELVRLAVPRLMGVGGRLAPSTPPLPAQVADTQELR